MASHGPRLGLWIDAICINQDDIAERNQQISIMATIYKAAQEVYVWLGVGDDDTNYAIDHIDNSSPETQFDQQVFSGCAQKLFLSSYWTRRWVIQEFALARELIIVCGRRHTHWRNLLKSTGDVVLGSGTLAAHTLERFQGVRSIDSRAAQSTLLELMEEFRDARCADPRDKVFALRGIAEDGYRIEPDYEVSLADVFFWVLSTMPTQRVWPHSLGYRWPHEDAQHLRSCMLLTKEDVLKSLATCGRDRLYAVFEYIGHITKVRTSSYKNLESCPEDDFASFTLELELDRVDSWLCRGSGRLMLGDQVYTLQSTSRSPRGFYLAFRPSATHTNLVGMLIEIPNAENVTYWRKNGLDAKTIVSISNIISRGVLKCSRNASLPTTCTRILCHISRLVLILLWLVDSKQVNFLIDTQDHLNDSSEDVHLSCDCPQGNGNTHALDSNGAQSHNDRLEILPGINFQEDTFWASASAPLWADESYELYIENDNMNRGFGGLFTVDHWKNIVLVCCGRWTVNLTKELLLKDEFELSAKDAEGKSAFWWAAYGGNEEVVQLISEKMEDVRAFDAPLERACMSGSKDVVQILLKGRLNLNPYSEIPASALHAASGNGYEDLVQMLLEHGADVAANDSNALDVALLHGHGTIARMLLENGAWKNAKSDGLLLWASRGGHAEVVKILLENGANCSAEQDLNRMSLEEASHFGHAKVVQMLLEGKVIECGFIGRAVQLALQGDHEEVVELLLRHRVTDTVPDSWHVASLYNAALKGHEKLVQVLAEKGALTETNFHVALLLAVDKGHENVVQILLEKGVITGIDLQAARSMTKHQIDDKLSQLAEGEEGESA